MTMHSHVGQARVIQLDSMNYSLHSAEISTADGMVPPHNAIAFFVKVHPSIYIRRSGFSDHGLCQITLKALERQLRSLFPRGSVRLPSNGQSHQEGSVPVGRSIQHQALAEPQVS